MPITAITIENFKGIAEDPVRVEFKPITLLFGPNSAGKSTIVQALHYAREIFERQNLTGKDPTQSTFDLLLNLLIVAETSKGEKWEKIQPPLNS